MAAYHHQQQRNTTATSIAANTGERAVFAGNLSYATTEATLHGVFSRVGDIDHIQVLVFHDTQRPKGAAVVHFVDAEAAARAIERLDGTEIDGRTVHLRTYFTSGPPAREPRTFNTNGATANMAYQQQGGHQRGGEGVVVTVNNLPFACTWRQLKDTFGRIAPVMRADVMRGAGTVSFATVDEAMTAVKEMNGADMGGRPMAVRMARP